MATTPLTEPITMPAMAPPENLWGFGSSGVTCEDCDAVVEAIVVPIAGAEDDGFVVVLGGKAMAESNLVNRQS
jgi:hypothetical protein